MHCSQYFRFENSFVGFFFVDVVVAVVVSLWRIKKNNLHLALLRFSRYGIFGNLLLWISWITFFLFRWFCFFFLLFSFLILFIYFTKMNISCGHNLNNETITTPSKRHRVQTTTRQTDKRIDMERKSKSEILRYFENYALILEFPFYTRKINNFNVHWNEFYFSVCQLIIDLACNPFYFPFLGN